MRKFASICFTAMCAIGSAILLVSGGLSSNDPYVVSRSVANPVVCQEMATQFSQRFHFQTRCLIEIPAVKGDRLR